MILSKLNLSRVLFITFFGLATMGQLGRIEITSNIAIYLHELVLGTWAVFQLPDLTKLAPRVVKKIINYKYLVVLLSYIALQLVVTQLISPSLNQIAYYLRAGFYLLLPALIFVNLKQQILTVDSVKKGVLAMSFGIAVLGIFQYLWLPDTRFLVGSGWDDHYYRLISTLLDPGFTGLLIGLGLLFTFSQKSTKFIWLTRLIFTVSLLLTYSRASILATLVGLAYLTWKVEKKALLLIIVIILAMPLLPRPAGEGVRLERTASINSRWYSSQEAITSLSYTEVALGTGFYRFDFDDTRTLPDHAEAPENSWVFILVSLGLLGSSLLTLVSKEIFTKNKLDSVILSLIFTIGIHAIFNNSLFYIWTWIFIYPLVLLSFTGNRHPGAER